MKDQCFCSFVTFFPVLDHLSVMRNQNLVNICLGFNQYFMLICIFNPACSTGQFRSVRFINFNRREHFVLLGPLEGVQELRENAKLARLFNAFRLRVYRFCIHLFYNSK